MTGQPARGPGRQRPRGFMPLVHLWGAEYVCLEPHLRRRLAGQRKAERRRLRGAA